MSGFARILAAIWQRAVNRTASGWSRPQRLLHWLIVVMCLSQIPTSWAIDRSHVAHVFNLEQNPVDLFLHQVHIWVGISIAFIAAARVILRLVYGAPPLPPGMGSMQRILAHVGHWGLYLLLGLSPVAGFITAYLDGRFGQIHVVLNWTLLGLASLHVLAALWHHFVRKDDLVRRMIRG